MKAAKGLMIHISIPAALVRQIAALPGVTAHYIKGSHIYFEGLTPEAASILPGLTFIPFFKDSRSRTSQLTGFLKGHEPHCDGSRTPST